jgi:hypothetical protein
MEPRVDEQACIAVRYYKAGMPEVADSRPCPVRRQFLSLRWLLYITDPSRPVMISTRPLPRRQIPGRTSWSPPRRIAPPTQPRYNSAG